MSLNEIAVDLTCDPEVFQPATTTQLRSASYDPDDDETPIPGKFAFPAISKKDQSEEDPPQYQVHGGMLKLAKAMGDIGKPVHLAVLEALYNNPDYGTYIYYPWIPGLIGSFPDLILCGHSLGAGVAAILGMVRSNIHCFFLPNVTRNHCIDVGRSQDVPDSSLKWTTCWPSSPSIFLCTTVYISLYLSRTYQYLTSLLSLVRSLTDANLTSFTEKLIVSLVYSHDIVSRLSLGSVRDLRNAAMWLCEAEANDKCNEGWSSITQRANLWKDGKGTKDDMNWVNPFLSSFFFFLLISYNRQVHRHAQNPGSQHAKREIVSSRSSSLGYERRGLAPCASEIPIKLSKS